MFHGPSPRDLPSPQAAHRATCWDVNPHWARPINRSEAATMASLPDRSSSELTGVSRRTRVRTCEQRHRPAIPRRSHRLSTRESISAIVSVAGFCVGATSQGPGVARESQGSRTGCSGRCGGRADRRRLAGRLSGRRHANHLNSQLDHGGLLLWVRMVRRAPGAGSRAPGSRRPAWVPCAGRSTASALAGQAIRGP